MTVTPAMSAQRAAAICARAAEAHATAGVPWGEAVHHTVRSLITRLAAARALPDPGLSYPSCPPAETVLDELGPLTGWQVTDLGDVHQLLLELTPVTGADGTVWAVRPDQGRRDRLGAWYTPPEVSAALLSLGLTAQLDRLAADPDPAAVTDLAVIDPACGAGVILVEAARQLADLFAARVTGQTPPPPVHARAALPVVMEHCVYGVDIDPVAVDLTKTALWLEVAGLRPFGFMDRNITVGNVLEDILPPAYRDLYGVTS
ncbi:N-6 DNA methylase [Streptomyces sp. STCH 565 A]|uniref:N-6 DNA methylase n=1 Tax=Streptomyces sp. STCH 565 A TaxID=2950532 RepID=UPI002074EBEF|nr:N-6 DNA methylase [Streptomyces sp. STCH 565 A]MCM8548938.1 N-6 DNA methylase [Streptomyces sp. STCH 565 A]